MTQTGVRIACDEVHELAEGPFWDPRRRRLLWVDILRGLVLVGRLDDDGGITVEDRAGFGATVGAVAVADDGTWIVAGAQQLFVRHDDTTVDDGPRILPPGCGRILNDGKPDPAGRFLVGSLTPAGGSQGEVLVAVDADATVRVIDDDLTLSNGLGWSRDGTILYSVDSERRVVYRRPYDVATGATGTRAVFLELDAGLPDGLCLDAEDHLWLAVHGLGQVRRYDPHGRLVSVVDVPAPQTTAVAFAGADLDVLVVTTAREDMDAAALAAHPLSGRIFTIRPGVRGRPQPMWGGFSAVAAA